MSYRTMGAAIAESLTTDGMSLYEIVEILLQKMQLKDEGLRSRFKKDPGKYMDVVLYQIGWESTLNE